MLNIPLIVLGSIASCLAVGCIIKHCAERKQHKVRIGQDYFTAKEEREMKIRHLQERYIPAGRRSHDSVPLRNPAYYTVHVPI